MEPGNGLYSTLFFIGQSLTPHVRPMVRLASSTLPTPWHSIHRCVVVLYSNALKVLQQQPQKRPLPLLRLQNFYVKFASCLVLPVVAVLHLWNPPCHPQCSTSSIVGPQQTP